MKTDLEMILEIGESFFSARKSKELLAQILDGAKALCQSERATLFLASDEAGTQDEVLHSFMATDLGQHIKEITVPAGLGIVGLTYKTKQAQVVNGVEENPHFLPKIDQISQFTTRSILSMPLISEEGKALGVIQVLNKIDGDFDESDLRSIRLLSLLIVAAMGRIENQETVQKLKNRIRQFKSSQLTSIVMKTEHDELQQIYEKIKVVANSTSSVLLLGESGTGKEVMARWIHEKSDRRDGPFIAVNCAAIPKELFESELFGIKKGTATGVEEREGLFQAADGGTLFFDEIGEMPCELQSKLLRVLQQKSITRVGDRLTESKVNFRLISATNKKLKDRLGDDDGFREDLYFRINVFEFNLPPLRERMCDIPFLAPQLMEKISQEQGSLIHSLSTSAMNKLQSYTWPGNIRELKNVIERACVLAQGRKEIEAGEILLPLEEGLVLVANNSSEESAPLKAIVGAVTDMDSATKKFQRAFALQVIETCQGNKSQAARNMQLSREGLRKILKRNVA